MKPDTGQRRGEAGFSLIEVLIALLILLIGVAGVLTMQMTSIRATSYSRHATEAAVVGEERLEFLRTVDTATFGDGSDVVDSRGVEDADGDYTRTWTISPNGTYVDIVVVVSWLERGSESHSMTFTSKRRATPP